MSTNTWDEQPLEVPPDAPKITRAKTERTFTGDVNGKGRYTDFQCLFADTSLQGVAFYNLVYHPEGAYENLTGTASFVGMTYFSGEIKGKGKGTIVLNGRGIYSREEGPTAVWETDPKTGTGDLAGLKATGGYKGFKGDTVTLEIAA